MSLVVLQEVSIGYRGPALLDAVDCRIDAGQRIGLLGRNGAGKTTLMRLIVGEETPDAGEILCDPSTRIALLPQDVPSDLQGSIRQIIQQGLDGQDLPSWEVDQLVEQIASRMKLELGGAFESLSSGMKRRVLLARALVSNPDLLLLDEPTNHLDIEAISWLESFLAKWPGAILFVTHDRTFLQNLATRILEVEGGRLFDWSCDYQTFLQRKEAALAAEEKQNALFDKRLQQEEVWIRQGIKARRTRNEGRVRALKAMRVERQQRREKTGRARLEIHEGQRSGNLVAEVKEISFSYPDLAIVKEFSTMIMRGDKIGVIGPNGAGKTTLLRLLLGTLEPQSGSVRHGANLQVAYFDQLREQLDEDASVEENVGEGSQSVMINGKSKHVLGYLQDFLFTPERARMPVRFLSGGERNRVLLAKLFARTANVIVLDEPTNDLDAETLELLEERLVNYPGTVLVVSHDPTFLNNVVSSSIVFEPGEVREYVGGYDDWVRQRPSPEAQETSPKPASKSASKPASNPVNEKKQKMSFKEKRELEQLPATIEQLEAEIAALLEVMAQPDYYQQNSDKLAADKKNLADSQAELATAMDRWCELEELAG
ncbi:MAG: ATP-binding cassette domain-containing protein [Planctomycetota bacterium]|nr:ATP-binding cassette domain-containing protein [Planctomycetota bacterium]